MFFICKAARFIRFTAIRLPVEVQEFFSKSKGSSLKLKNCE